MSDEFDGEAITRKAGKFADRLQRAVCETPDLHPYTPIEAIVGITLYTIVTSRTLGMDINSLHQLVETVDNRFPSKERVEALRKLGKLFGKLAESLGEASERKGRRPARPRKPAPENLPEAVKQADAEADRIIAAAVKDVPDTPPDEGK